MRNLKKILCLALVLSMVLAGVSGAAYKDYADADEITRNAAAMVAETIAEVAGMTLTVASESGNAPALILEIGSFDTDRSYSFSMDGQTLRLKASDSTTLYFAAEAVLKTWLTPDFGLRTEGVLSLDDRRVSELNGVTTRLDTSIRVLSQNVRNALVLLALSPVGSSAPIFTQMLGEDEGLSSAINSICILISVVINVVLLTVVL